MERRVFAEPIMREASTDSLLDVTGRDFIRCPALIARKSVPYSDDVQDQAKKKNKMDRLDLLSDRSKLGHRRLTLCINISRKRGLSRRGGFQRMSC